MVAQLIVVGLANAAVYSLLAVGFAVIFNATRILHIAHGAVFTFGAYSFYVAAVHLGLPLWAAALAAVLLAGVAGCLVEVAVYRPVRSLGGGENALLITTLGLLSVMQGVYALVFGTDLRILLTGPLPTFSFGGVHVTFNHLVSFIASIVIFIGLQLFLRFSRVGIAIRALADNKLLLQTQGINVDRLHAAVFFVGSALAGFAAVFVSLDIGVQPTMGFQVILIAIVAVIMGGVGYLPGALLGAFLLSFAQQFAVWMGLSQWQEGVVFIVLLLVLLVRPQGFFGARLSGRKV